MKWISKERRYKLMCYQKPELNVLGNAAQVIQGAKGPVPTDGQDLSIPHTELDAD
jgi:hypothetical protein